MFKYRKYQELSISAGIKSLQQHTKDIILSPTGSGKSLVITGICRELNYPTLILQPNKEILEQNYSKLESYGITDMAMYSASMGSKEIAKYTYATIGSIKDVSLFKHFRYCIVDECDLVNPAQGMYRDFFKKLPLIRVIGLTASPYRMLHSYYRDTDGGTYYTSMLQVLTKIAPRFFKGFAFKVNIKRLIDEGYLAPIDYVFPEEIDPSSLPLNTTESDYDEEAVEDYLNSPENIQKVVNAVIENDHLPNNLIFCSSVLHARNCADLLSKLGHNCEVITGKDPTKERDRKISQFREGKIKKLLNVGVLTTGFDYPGLYGITIGRPTISLRLLYQMIGRGVRIDPLNMNKRCTVIDLCGSIKRIGRIESIRVGKVGNDDVITTEMGQISGRPLFTFKLKDKDKIAKLNL